MLDTTSELARLNRKIDAVESEIDRCGSGVAQAVVDDMKSRLASLEKQKAEVLTLLRLTRERETAAGSISSSSSSSSSIPPAPVVATTTILPPTEPQHHQLQEQGKPKTTGRGRTAPGNAAGAGECAIHAGSLRSVLQCPLCSECLLDAAVLPCSHGFCLSCLERRMCASQSSQCPVCAGDAPRAPPSSLSGRGRGRRPYVRSLHLDGAVGVLLDASTAAERSRFQEREQAARRYLASIGVDPDASEGVGEEGSVSGGGVASSGSVSSRGGSGRRAEGGDGGRESSAGSGSGGSGSGGSEDDSYEDDGGGRREDSCDA